MTAAQLSVEAVARRLCLAMGHSDPDSEVYHFDATRLCTPIGSVFAPRGTPFPLWRSYESMARAVLADIAAGRLG